MASSLTASLRHRCVIVAVLLVAGFLGLVAGYAPEVSVSCRTMLDLRTTQYEAGVLVSALPERIPVYANEEEKCDINLSIGTGSVLMIYFDWLDFYAADMSKCDSTNIQLYDGSIGVYVSGLNRQICGREEQMPSGVYFIEKYHLIIRVSALGVIHGSGFRIHFTLSRRAFPCSANEFSCETFGAKRCIASHLVCDDWNDCGDWVDEQQDCNNVTAGGIAAIVIAAVGLLALIVGLVIFCKCRRDRELQAYSEKDPAIMRGLMGQRETSAASPVSGGLMAPYSISTEQMEKEYTPRYSNARSSRRSNKDFKADYEEERPPPYTEKGPPGVNDSRSDIYDDDSRRRRSRKDIDEEVFDEDERRSRRGRRSRTSSVDRDDKQRNGDDRIPRDRDEPFPTRRGPDDSRDSIRAREEPKDERYPRRGPDDRDRNDRDRNYPPPPRDDLDRDYPPPPRDDYRPSRRYDDRDSDSKHSRDSERDRRRDERSRDRDPRRSRRSEPDDRNSMDEEGPVDQLHPLREVEKSRRSLHSDSDLDSRSDKEKPRRSEKRDQRDDRDQERYPPRDKNDRGHPSRGRSDDDDDDDEYRAPPPGRGDRPTSRHERPPAGREEREDTPPKSRPFRSGSPPPPPPAEDDEDENDDEGQHRRRRRRSRSREDRQRSRYGDAARNGGDRSRESVSGLREEAV